MVIEGIWDRRGHKGHGGATGATKATRGHSPYHSLWATCAFLSSANTARTLKHSLFGEVSLKSVCLNEV